jgi:hypothetical protein
MPRLALTARSVAALGAAAILGIAVASCNLTGINGGRVAGVTDAEASFCTRRSGPVGGIFSVASAAELMGLPHEPPSDGMVVDLADPTAAASCELAYELWSLTDEQWNWCFEDANRATFLAAAITAFGMGEAEAAGTENFAEAPGDDPGEYTQACRWAFDRWREDGIAPIVDPRGDPFFSVTAAEAEWCGSNLEAQAVDKIRDRLGIEIGPGASEAELALAEARTCRVAYILRTVSTAE